jgi:hypothetical protein
VVLNGRLYDHTCAIRFAVPLGKRDKLVDNARIAVRVLEAVNAVGIGIGHIDGVREHGLGIERVCVRERQEVLAADSVHQDVVHCLIEDLAQSARYRPNDREERVRAVNDVHVLLTGVGDGVDLDVSFAYAEHARRRLVGTEDDVSLAVGLESALRDKFGDFFGQEGFFCFDWVPSVTVITVSGPAFARLYQVIHILAA